MLNAFFFLKKGAEKEIKAYKHEWVRNGWEITLKGKAVLNMVWFSELSPVYLVLILSTGIFCDSKTSSNLSKHDFVGVVFFGTFFVFW